MNYEEMETVQYLYERGKKNGAIGIELCSRERILDLEPKLTGDVVGGLYAPGGGIIEPYRFVFALVESAQKNGVHVITDFEVSGAEWDGKLFRLQSSDGRGLDARYVVNAAGLYADRVSAIFGAEEFTITPRKGEYYLLDRMTRACPDRVLFPVPSKISKGVLVIPTVEGTVLLGPTAEEEEDKEDLSTSSAKLKSIFDSARKMIPKVSTGDVITAFSGLRPAMASGDFYIEASKKRAHFIQVAGIQSPGLTAAPAIAEYVKEILKNEGLVLQEQSNYDPTVPRVPRIRNIDAHDIDELIKTNPAYGNIICRCENISEAEIIEAIRRGHHTLDGIKFFTRSGMGRCQGGFCTGRIIEIIMRETGKNYNEISKRGKNSTILRRSL
jgi:glycerol-3-phosphate dehydrogenase